MLPFIRIGLIRSAVFLCLLSACGSDDEKPEAWNDEDSFGGETTSAEGESGDGIVDEEVGNLLEQLVRSECEWLFNCCDRGELNLDLGPFTSSADECVERVFQSLESGGKKPPVSSGPSSLLIYLSYAVGNERIALNPDAVEACIAQKGQNECNSIPSDQSQSEEHCEPAEVDEEEPEDLCTTSKLFSGLQKVGDPCTTGFDVECEEGSHCVRLDAATGVCVEAVPEGEYCFYDSDCAEELYCNYAEGRCASYSELGESCTFADPENPERSLETQTCGEGLNCHPTNFVCVDACNEGASCWSGRDCPEGLICASNYCQKPAEAGAECEYDYECASEICEQESQTCIVTVKVGTECQRHKECESSYCDYSVAECAPSVAIGEACDGSNSAQCRKGYCSLDPESREYVCTPYGKEGEECSFRDPCNSELELVCIEDVCESVPLEDGKPCTHDNFCKSEFCWEGSCQEKQAVDGPCSDSGLEKPCNEDSYCDVDAGEENGICRRFTPTGSSCEEDLECRDQCRVSWGHRFCGWASIEGAAYCDGDGS